MFDPLASDPPLDTDYPASTIPLNIVSSNEKLPGVLLLPAGPGPHPMVVLLHGFPGNERNHDLAQALRRAGYAAMVFNYRGSWGAGGSWSWNNVLEDSARVTQAVREAELATQYRLDADRVAVLGHSLGGFAALMTAAADPSISAAISISGFDFGTAFATCVADPATRPSLVAAWDGQLLPLKGTSGEALVAEMEAAGTDWSLPRLAPRFADRPVLLIGTSRDGVTPAATHHKPVVDAFQTHSASHLEDHVFAADHSLSDHRVTLARTVIGFLDRNLGSAA